MAVASHAFSPKEFQVWIASDSSTAGTSGISATDMYQLDVDSVGMPTLNVNQILDVRSGVGRTLKDEDVFQDNTLRVVELSISGVMHNDTGHKLLLQNICNDVSGDATVAAGGALTIANDSVEHVMLENRYTAVGTISNTSGATSVDWSAAAVYKMNSALTGGIEFDFTGFKAGQVLTIYNISGSQTITLDSDASNSESFLKVGGVDYDGSATSILQVECLADGADAVFAYSVAQYASDTTP